LAILGELLENPMWKRGMKKKNFPKQQFMNQPKHIREISNQKHV
jgi:hypothetical protein